MQTAPFMSKSRWQRTFRFVPRRFSFISKLPLVGRRSRPDTGATDTITNEDSRPPAAPDHAQLLAQIELGIAVVERECSSLDKQIQELTQVVEGAKEYLSEVLSARSRVQDRMDRTLEIEATLQIARTRLNNPELREPVHYWEAVELEQETEYSDPCEPENSPFPEGPSPRLYDRTIEMPAWSVEQP